MNLSSRPGSWILEAFSRGGVDTDLLLTRSPTLVQKALDHLVDLSAGEVNQLLSLCAEMTGDRHFGLHMINHVETHTMGAFGYLLLNASNVKQLFQLAERYYPALYRGGVLKFSLQNKFCLVKYRTFKPESVCPRHLTEWTLGFFIEFIRIRFNPGWQPSEVSFTHSPPDNLLELEKLFGTNILFQQATNSLKFSRDILHSTTATTDPALQQVIIDHLEKLLDQVINTQSFESRIKLSIFEKLGHQQLSSKAVAKEINISVSTLKRRLKKRNISFRSLRDEAIAELAKKALSETDATISDIALKIGYSELSAFSRAFTRICGLTPLEYRHSISPKKVGNEEAVG